MITAFGFGLVTSLAAGGVGDGVWRRLPPVLAWLAIVLGAGVAVGCVTLAAQLGLHVAGLGIPALVVGLIVGGNAANAITSRTLHRAR